jgi:hypothetical protein
MCFKFETAKHGLGNPGVGISHRGAEVEDDNASGDNGDLDDKKFFRHTASRAGFSTERRGCLFLVFPSKEGPDLKKMALIKLRRVLPGGSR